MNFNTELKSLKEKICTLDKRVIFIFISVAILQTVSWYFASRIFFRLNFFDVLEKANYNAELLEFIYWFVGDFIVFFVIPALIIFFLFKEKITEYGFSFREYKLGLSFSVIAVLLMIVIVWFISSNEVFSVQYPYYDAARYNWTEFLIFETALLLYVFAWEFIWRGYMLFGLEKKFGYYAVLIQMLPFVILHNGKPAIETFGAIIGGIALGILALRTRSFLYGFIIHFSVMFSIDLISSLRSRANDFGTGFKSLLNIITNLF
ncbi:MAG: type II CAAX endopeptidase family protein [Ignavibacteria bacterium]|jgi:membrane protease YdiL (CAAX protease family)